MPKPNPEAMEFLLTRRSRPAKTLTTPVPTREELLPILQAAARTPDHGKLEPWRFIVLEREALIRLEALASARASALGIGEDKAEKVLRQFGDGHLAVAVVLSPVVSEKVPEIEQIFSAGAACLGLLNGALASGWGANWLTGWACHDRDFVRDGLGLSDRETVVGLVHIGTERIVPPERPRPDLAAKIKWVSS